MDCKPMETLMHLTCNLGLDDSSGKADSAYTKV